MAIVLWKTAERRVGVVGLYAAGKTVFLTSLLNHLKDHDPDRFKIGDRGGVVRKFRELPCDDGWPRFDYERHRNALVHGRDWPDKTADRAQFACSFERTDWHFNESLLKFYDLPGERIADAAMGRFDYAGWSDHTLRLLDADSAYRDCAAAFLGLQDRPDANAAALYLEYRLTLARLILRFKPYVSPSTFFLDVKGRLARGSTPEALAEGRVSGLDPGREFVPLSAAARARHPQLAARFAECFRQYKAEILWPYVTALRSCHALVVLIDVTMLLAGGSGMYDDNHQVLRDLLDVLDPGESRFGRAARWLSDVLLPHEWRPGWITRIAFVAPKLDQVHPRDRDRMVTLLQRMLGPEARNRDGLTPLFTNCCAVRSTQTFPGRDGQRLLLGSPLRGPDGRKLMPGPDQELSVSELPDDWPADWGPGQYHFPEVHPRVPPRKDRPPDQVNLDQILTFLMG